MYIPIASVVNAIAKAQEFAEHYRQKFISGDGFPKSVEGLESLVRDYIHPQKFLRVHNLKIPAGSAKAACFVENGGYTIVTYNSPDERWNRLIFCKELFHVVLDEESCHCMDITNHLSRMLIPSLEQGEPSTTSEFVAEVAAFEFLFPFELRLKEREASISEDEKYPAIAQFYVLPQAKIEQYLSPSWMKFFGTLSRLKS